MATNNYPGIDDFGPLYTETNIDNLIKEPYNAASNILFLLIVIYWLNKTKFQVKKYPFLVSSQLILLIGFIGGTIYHATRSHDIWLILDFVPIIILALAAAIRFWQLYTGKLYLGILLPLVISIIPRATMFQLELEKHLRIGIGYLTIALSILIPAYLIAVKFKISTKNLNLAVIFFLIALTCRTLDLSIADYLPMGSHFLWHIFGAFSVFFLFNFLYQLNRESLEKQS